MESRHFEIVGADRTDVRNLAAAISAATGLAPTSINEYSAHFTARDGITDIGVAPAYPSMGPAVLFTLGPAGEDVEKQIAAVFESEYGWVLTAQYQAA